MGEEEIEEALALIAAFASAYDGPNAEAMRQVAIRASEDERTDDFSYEPRSPRERLLDALSVLVGLAFPATAETLDLILGDLTELTGGYPVQDMRIEVGARMLSARETLPISRDAESAELFQFFTELLATPHSRYFG